MTTKQRIKRNHIVSVARDVFKNYGYKKTTMNDVAKAAGKGKSSIYYYFDSKDAIFKSVILSEARIYRNTVLESSILPCRMLLITVLIYEKYLT